MNVFICDAGYIYIQQRTRLVMNSQIPLIETRSNVL